MIEMIPLQHHHNILFKPEINSNPSVKMLMIRQDLSHYLYRGVLIYLQFNLLILILMSSSKMLFKF